VIKQAIPSVLAGFVRRCIIKLKVIVRRMFRGEIPISFIIACAEVIAACMRDDVIIVDIRVIISTRLVAVIEKVAGSRCVIEFRGINAMVLAVFVGVVQFFQDGATLATVVDSDSNYVLAKVVIAMIPISLIHAL